MQLKPGMRLQSAVSTTEIVVVRPPVAEVSLTCGGREMVDEAMEGGPAPGAATEDGTVLGRRYVDETSGMEVLCTKAGAGALACDGRPLTTRTPKPLPSSD